MYMSKKVPKIDTFIKRERRIDMNKLRRFLDSQIANAQSGYVHAQYGNVADDPVGDYPKDNYQRGYET